MSKDLYKVITAQFLTAFADNAVLFTIITIVLNSLEISPWYIPALQASFLIFYVILAPWVGPFADTRPKPTVMTLANFIKAVGAGLILINVEPLIAYAIVGLGAAIYGPAKYGILPELVSEDDLVKANGWVEGSTILAILGGSLIGALVSEQSIQTALIFVIILYLISGAIAFFITKRVPKTSERKPALSNFMYMMRRLMKTPRARFATMGVSLFWSAATVLRLLIVAWAPVVLLITESSEIAKLTMFVAIGIAIGSFFAPRLVPMAHLRRARMAAYMMGLTVILLSAVSHLWTAWIVLFLIGIAGGIFVVPINAALQDVGHKTIGSGGAVAIQNFFQNLTMLVASGIYSVAAGLGAGPVVTMLVLGVLILIATVVVSRNLPPNAQDIEVLSDEANE